MLCRFILLLIICLASLSAQAALLQVHGAGSRQHLVQLPSKYTHKPELVHRDSLADLTALLEAARQDDIKLSVFSAYRSYHHQKLIWDKKWGKHKDDDIAIASEILQYSSVPGLSRHHWGSDVDFNSVEMRYWQSDEGKKAYEWLKNNAATFGFCEVYNEGRDMGYLAEPWHWSHLAVANRYHAEILQPDILAVALAQNIKGKQAINALSTTLTDYLTSVNDCIATNPDSPDNTHLTPNAIPDTPLDNTDQNHHTDDHLNHNSNFDDDSLAAKYAKNRMF